MQKQLFLVIALLSGLSCFGMEKEIGKIEESIDDGFKEYIVLNRDGFVTKARIFDDSDENNFFVLCNENGEEVAKYVGDPKLLQMAFTWQQKVPSQDIEDIYDEQY